MEHEASFDPNNVLNKKASRREFLKALPFLVAGATSACSDIQQDTLSNLTKGLPLPNTDHIPKIINELRMRISFFEPEPPVTLYTKHQRQPLVEKIKGVNLPSWYKGEYQKLSSVQSFENARELYPNLIGIIPTLYQETINSTEIIPTDNTATDDDLRYIIQQAHLFGYQVMLKPHLILHKDPKHWHGQIGQHFTQEQWAQWFNSYQNMINHYAQIAQETGVELFVVANEARHSALHRAREWIQTVHGIRKHYSGPLTYAAHMEDFEQMTWWNELDYLGLNPYFSLSKKLSPTLSELRTVWNGIASRIEKTAKRLGKPVIFPEIGYPSVKGSAYQPYNFNLVDTAVVDVQQQANCYQAMYEAVWNKDWMKGIVIWDWDIDPSIGGLRSGDYTVKDKPAAKIITKYHLN